MSGRGRRMLPKIFIVDDNDVNLISAKEALKDHYFVMTMPSAAKMLTLIEKITPSLILLDIEMPEIDGFQALSLLKSNPKYQHIPVIFVTSISNSDVESQGFEKGVVDFITKPFSPAILLHRVRVQLDIENIIKERTNRLEERTEELMKLQNSIVFTLVDMIEGRDKETGGHINRTSTYMELILREMMKVEKFAVQINALNFNSLVTSSKLHDIGKFFVSDNILNKPGRLTDEEVKKMETHTTEGERVINLIGSSKAGLDFLDNAKTIAISHHEKWDGSGYPKGLKGLEIPLQGRIMAVVDVFDALTSERPYKRAFSPEEAINIIAESAGTHFDPEIVEIFYKAKDRFIETAHKLKPM